jgi:hypothetical protein
MTNQSSMQSVVASICRVKNKDDGLFVEQLHGTGFYINDSGYLLTAKHVIEKGRLDVQENGGFLAFCPSLGMNKGNAILPLIQIEFAPNGFDVALVKTNSNSTTFYKYEKVEVGPWRDIATFGYPASVVHRYLDQFRIQCRYHKGYIQREVPRDRTPDGNNPPLFEVNFPITQGLSGAPLFLRADPKDVLVGICVGSTQSQLVIYEETEIEEDGAKYQERVVKVEEFGIVHDIRELGSWLPGISNGKDFEELMNGS